MILDYSKSEEYEHILNEWLEEKCTDIELILVNNVPLLAEDCLSILTGSVTNVKNYDDKLIVTTNDNIDNVLEAYN